MFYQDVDRGHFDYRPTPIPGFPGRWLRGPAVDRSRPYVACIGAAQTFGRFCTRPFPALLADRLGIQVENHGAGGAGLGWFDRPDFLDYLNGAQLVIVQVMSGRSEGNSLFDNSATGSQVGVRLSDGKEMRFEAFLDELTRTESRRTVTRIVRETRDNYERGSIRLLERIRPPTILFWFSKRTPDYRDDYSTHHSLMGEFPQLVNRRMIDTIRSHANAYVECVSTRGLPQRLWAADQRINGAILEDGVLHNRYYPSPEMHVEATDLLESPCRELLGKLLPRNHQTPLPMTASGIPFVIITTARAGSNMLRGMIDSHPLALVGGELFNTEFFKSNKIPWPVGNAEQDPELLELRRSDPVTFVNRLHDLAAKSGHRAIGFKLFYHQGDTNEALLNYLASDTNIRIIHLTRQNRLRRYLSLERAKLTGVWARPATATPTAKDSPLPAVQIDFAGLVKDFQRVEDKEREYRDRFKDHDVLEISYEDLAKDPHAVGARAIAFLGLEPAKLEIRHKKSGTDSLREAISNYEELRSSLRTWESFFEA